MLGASRLPYQATASHVRSLVALFASKFRFWRKFRRKASFSSLEFGGLIFWRKSLRKVLFFLALKLHMLEGCLAGKLRFWAPAYCPIFVADCFAGIGLPRCVVLEKCALFISLWQFSVSHPKQRAESESDSKPKHRDGLTPVSCIFNTSSSPDSFSHHSSLYPPPNPIPNPKAKIPWFIHISTLFAFPFLHPPISPPASPQTLNVRYRDAFVSRPYICSMLQMPCFPPFPTPPLIPRRPRPKP